MFLLIGNLFQDLSEFTDHVCISPTHVLNDGPLFVTVLHLSYLALPSSSQINSMNYTVSGGSREERML